MEYIFLGRQKYYDYTEVAKHFYPDNVVIILPITALYNHDLHKASLMDNVFIYEIPMGTDVILNARIGKYIEYYPNTEYKGDIRNFKF